MHYFLTLIPILSLVGYGAFLSEKYSIKFIYTVPSLTSLVIVCLTFFAMIGFLPIATIMLYVGGLVCLFLFLRKEGWKKIENGQEIIFFSVLLIFFFLYTKNGYFKAWDDFSHWGVFTKELLYRNSFETYDLPTSILQSHAHYPRGGAIFHYYMMKTTGYSEGGSLFSHFLLYLIFLFPLLQNKKIFHSVFLCSSVIAVFILYSSGLRSIYNDNSTGLIFGSILSIFILEKNKNSAFLLLLPMIACLPLIREIGLILSFFVVIILYNYNKAYYDKENSPSFSSIKISLFNVIPFITSFLWKWYFEKTHSFFGRKTHNLDNFLSIFNHSDNMQLFFHFAKAWCSFLIKEGSLTLYVLCGLSLYFIYKNKPHLLKEYKRLLASLALCFFLFSLWRLYLYFITFSYEEAIKGASLSRYLGCYVISIAFICATYLKKAKIETSSFAKLLTVIFAYIIAKNMMRIPHTASKEDQRIYEYSQQVRAFLKNNHPVTFHFYNKKGNDLLLCYKLNYYIAPYMKKEDLMKCVNTVNHNETSVITFDTDKNPVLGDTIPKDCRLEYIPFLPQAYCPSSLN